MNNRTAAYSKQRAKKFKDQKDVTKASDFSYQNFKKEKGKEETKIGQQEMKHLIHDKGISRKEVFADIQKRADEGAVLGDRVQNKLDKFNSRQAAKAKAKQQQQQSQTAQQRGDQAAQAAKLEADVNPSYISGNQNAENTGDIEQETKITNTQGLDVSNDNKIINDVSGDNNRIYNSPDNSVRQYGGDNRSMVINEANTGNQGGGAGGSGYQMSGAEKALMYGTIGGMYSVDDSPAAIAKRVDLAQTLNADAQKKYQFAGAKIADMYSGYKPGSVNRADLQASIESFPQKMYDKATMAKVDAYGDRDANKGYVPFEMGDPLERIESNADEIAESYKDDIDDI